MDRLGFFIMNDVERVRRPLWKIQPFPASHFLTWPIMGIKEVEEDTKTTWPHTTRKVASRAREVMVYFLGGGGEEEEEEGLGERVMEKNRIKQVKLHLVN